LTEERYYGGSLAIFSQTDATDKAFSIQAGALEEKNDEDWQYHEPTRASDKPDGTLREVATLMKKIDAGVLPVAERDKLIGMITDRDIAIRGMAEGKGPNTKVREVMSHEVKYCFEDEDVAHVAQNMAELQVRRLPVMNRDKRLVGIVSLGDLATEGSLPKTAQALHGISQPGGQHNQARAEA
jgi:CBS-domain-containing membrane protein